jgi:hypothetical protein
MSSGFLTFIPKPIQQVPNSRAAAASMR